jgi:GNAT superfamily N-acetyltransferase
VQTAWLRYARQATVGGIPVHLLPLEECHRRQLEDFEDRLDAETTYMRYGAYVSAELRKSYAWLHNNWSAEDQERFSQGAFLNGCLIGIGSIYKLPGGKSAEIALVVAREFQGLGSGGRKGVGGLLLEDLIRYARDQHFERVTARFAAPNPHCDKLLRKYGLDVSRWSYLKQEGSATLDLHRLPAALTTDRSDIRKLRPAA